MLAAAYILKDIIKGERHLFQLFICAKCNEIIQNDTTKIKITFWISFTMLLAGNNIEADFGWIFLLKLVPLDESAFFDFWFRSPDTNSEWISGVEFLNSLRRPIAALNGWKSYDMVNYHTNKNTMMTREMNEVKKNYRSFINFFAVSSHQRKKMFWIVFFVGIFSSGWSDHFWYYVNWSLYKNYKKKINWIVSL